MTLGERIRQERKKAGLSQEELANTLNVSRQSIQKWEADLNSPSVEAVKNIAQYFNVDLNYLITGEESIKYVNKNKKIKFKKPTKFTLFVISLLVTTIALLSYYFIYIKIINPYSYAKDGGYIHTGLLAYILGPDADKTPIVIFCFLVAFATAFVVCFIIWYIKVRKERLQKC